MENYAQTKKVERIIVSCLLFLVVIAVVAVYSFVALGKARSQNAHYDEVIAQLKAERADLAGDIEHVSSPNYWQDQAINNQGYIRDGDKIFIISKK